MAKGYRKERLEKELLRQLGEIVAHRMKDPRISLATVTRVELSPDLAFAKVYVTLMGGDKAKEQGVSLLNKARAYVQSVLKKEIRIRVLPELRFIRDKGIENVHRVEKIFKELAREKTGEEE